MRAQHILIALAMLATPAWSFEQPQMIGLHVASLHSAAGFCNFDPGVYARWGSGFTVGAYRNSECRASAYAGMTWDKPLTDRITGSITLGAVTGYRRAPVMPLMVPSVQIRLDDAYALRVAFIPKVEKSGAHALHFMVERRF
jgi:hypothetical protein